MKIIGLLGILGTLGLLNNLEKNKTLMNDTDNIEGTWYCVSAIVNGKTLPKATTELLRLTLTKERYKTEKGTEVLFDSTYTLDPRKNPKEINMVGTEGELTGKIAPGIYSHDGKLLKLCYVMPGLPRPQSFESAEGTQIFLITWTRARASE